MTQKMVAEANMKKYLEMSNTVRTQRDAEIVKNEATANEVKRMQKLLSEKVRARAKRVYLIDELNRAKRVYLVDELNLHSRALPALTSSTCTHELYLHSRALPALTSSTCTHELNLHFNLHSLSHFSSLPPRCTLRFAHILCAHRPPRVHIYVWPSLTHVCAGCRVGRDGGPVGEVCGRAEGPQ